MLDESTGMGIFLFDNIEQVFTRTLLCKRVDFMEGKNKQQTIFLNSDFYGLYKLFFYMYDNASFSLCLSSYITTLVQNTAQYFCIIGSFAS